MAIKEQVSEVERSFENQLEACVNAFTRKEHPFMSNAGAVAAVTLRLPHNAKCRSKCASSSQLFDVC